MREKHVPVRTCAGCGTQSSQRDLVRIVRTVSGGAQVDTTGKQAGRGTYLCPRLPCWETGVGKRRVDHALRVSIASPERQALLAFAQQRYGAALARVEE